MLEINILEIIKKITQKEHAKFLNTLSFMELCGAQKITKAFAFLPKTNFILEHMAEEYRHAFFLRKLANKLEAINDYENNNILNKKNSLKYMKNLDYKICLLFKNNKNLVYYSYLLTTYSIEKRAIKFYDLYQHILDKNNNNFNIKSILSEEAKHLNNIEELIAATNFLNPYKEKACEIENILFKKWIENF